MPVIAPKKGSTMEAYEYVVVSRHADGVTKVAGPYSERQARHVASNTLGMPEVVRVVRPTYWLMKDDDLDRYAETPAPTR